MFIDELAVRRLMLAAATNVTIASGVIVVTDTFHKVTVQTGSTDDLDTITHMGGELPTRVLYLRPSDDAATIVVKHNTGNILCQGNGDITLDDYHDFCTLYYDQEIAKWCAVSGGVTPHTHATAGTGGVLYQYKIHKFSPKQAPDSAIVAGEDHDHSMTGPVAETVVAIYSHFQTVGTSMTIDIDYNANGLSFDSLSWTQVDSNSHNAADLISKAVTSSFDTATIPADCLIRIGFLSITGTYLDGKVFLVTKFVPPTA